MSKDKKREWCCPYCGKTYKTESQICPECRRVMRLDNGQSKKVVYMEG